MTQWQPVELISEYWIILDQDYAEEYKKRGVNFMFDTKEQAEQFIKEI